MAMLGIVLVVVTALGLLGLGLMVSQASAPLPATPEQAHARGLQLVQAVKAGDDAMAQALLRSAPDLAARGEQGLSALHWAAHHGRLEQVDLLLKAGAAPGMLSDDGQTPLHELVLGADRARVKNEDFDQTRWVKVAARLLAAGAPAAAADRWGTTARQHAAQAGLTALAGLLEQHGG